MKEIKQKGSKMKDTILCHDKEYAKQCIDNIGSENIEDWEFLPNGKIRIILNCKLEQTKVHKK